ncbi:hypothetical protein F4679DRAFT_592374 [Xylaria curta]|nr:hypothetical protein F4679DRAFT_592374 [Xylaria curta]
MAELLGVTAASLQIGGMLVKLISSCTKLAKRLKDAPQEVRPMRRSVYDFQYLCDSCRAVLEKNAAEVNTVIQPTDVDQICAWLDHAYQKLQSLEKIIPIIEPQSNDNRRQKLLKAIRTVVKRDSVVADLQELDKVRNNIDSFFIRHNFSLSVVQSVKIEGQLHQDHDILVDTKTTITEISETQKLVLQNVEHMYTGLQASISTAHQTTLATLDSRLQDTKDYIDRGLAAVNRSSSDTEISQEVVEFTMAQLHRKDTHAATSTSSSLSPPMFCPCQRIGRVERLCTLGPITLVRLTYGTHYPGCQYYGQGNEERVARQLSVELSTNYEHRSSSFLNYAIACTSFLLGNFIFPRIINDEKNAPGFKHLSAAAFNIKTILGLHKHNCPALPRSRKQTEGQVLQCRGTLRSLYNDLLGDFNASREWEGIQTAGGKTLLHAFVYILWDLFTLQDELSGDVARILSLLIKGGTCVNAITRMPSAFIFTFNNVYTECGTALSLFMARIGDFDLITADKMIFLRLLSYHDIPSFSYCPPQLEPHLIVRLFIAVPELAIEYGCSRLALAVITRNESEVKHLIELHRRGQLKGDIDDSSDGLSPLCFAIGWPAGIKMLLEEGADPSQAIRIAIVCQEVRSLDILLSSNDYFLFRPKEFKETKTQNLWKYSLPCCSLLEFALVWRLRFFANVKEYNLPSNRIVESVLKAISDSRKGLMHLAIKVFSESQLASFGIVPGSLVDSNAGSMFTKLQQVRAEMPPKLYPGARKTIYHNARMTMDVADKLWHLGFHEIDETDDRGVTPLMVSMDIFSWSLGHDGLQWYIPRGARLAFPKLKNKTVVHILARHFTWNLWHIMRRHEFEQEPAKRTIQCLQSALKSCFKRVSSDPKDSCICSCSVEGCSMIHSLLRGRMLDKWFERQQAVDRWIEHLPKDESGLEALDITNNENTFLAGCYANLCRVEIFQRLNMRHTCCRCRDVWIDPSENVSYEFQPENPVARGHCVDDQITIAEGEKSGNMSEPLKTEILNRLTGLYGEFSCGHQGNVDAFKQFWNIWWDVLGELALPEEVPYYHDREVGVTHCGSKLTLENLDEIIGLIKGRITKLMATKSPVTDREAVERRRAG